MVGGGPALLVAEVAIGALIEEDLDHVDLPVERRLHERRESGAAPALPGIHGSSVLEEEAGDGHGAGGGGGVERHHVHSVRRGRVHPRPVFEQQLDGALMAEEAREAERAEAVIATALARPGSRPSSTPMRSTSPRAEASKISSDP